MRSVRAVIVISLFTWWAYTVSAQQLPFATDVNKSDIDAFYENLPKDRISDRPIRVVDVGGYKAGIYAAFRPQELSGRAIRHDTSVTEIYYMLEGSGTLVTGGILAEEYSSGNSPYTGRPNFAGPSIIGGRSRKVNPGDVIFIPGNTPHWWSSLDSDIKYLIFRPDPDGLQQLH